MVKTGRPKIAASKRQSRLVAVRFTPREYEQLERAAGQAGVTVSEYIRFRLEFRKQQ